MGHGVQPLEMPSGTVDGLQKTVQYRLHGQVLETATCVKYLRVDISSSLPWDSHVNRVVGNANRALDFIRRNIKTKMQRYAKWLTTPWSDLSSNIRPQYETRIQRSEFPKSNKSIEELLTGQSVISIDRLV